MKPKIRTELAVTITVFDSSSKPESMNFSVIVESVNNPNFAYCVQKNLSS
jgi:hypothetical protein